jgi:hypothetical protein
MNKYFWKNGNVCSYSPLQVKQGYADGLIELTKKEFDEHFNPPVSMEQLATEIREKRDRLIQQIEWRVNRHYQELELDLTPTEELRPLLEYIQALRDVPQQEGFPTNIVWPEAPV